MGEELEMSGCFELDDIKKALAEHERTAQEEDTKFNCDKCPAAQYMIKHDRIRQYHRQRKKDQDSFLLMAVVLGVPAAYLGIQLYNEISSCL